MVIIDFLWNGIFTFSLTLLSPSLNSYQSPMYVLTPAKNFLCTAVYRKALKKLKKCCGTNLSKIMNQRSRHFQSIPDYQGLMLGFVPKPPEVSWWNLTTVESKFCVQYEPLLVKCPVNVNHFRRLLQRKWCYYFREQMKVMEYCRTVESRYLGIGTVKALAHRKVYLHANLSEVTRV